MRKTVIAALGVRLFREKYSQARLLIIVHRKEILEYFDGRITSEIRLAEAIDRKLLSPFLYFGVLDTVDYTKVNWHGKYDVNQVESIYKADNKRTLLILNTVYKYVTDIDDVHGLRLHPNKECIIVLDFI